MRFIFLIFTSLFLLIPHVSADPVTKKVEGVVEEVIEDAVEEVVDEAVDDARDEIKDRLDIDSSDYNKKKFKDKKKNKHDKDKKGGKHDNSENGDWGEQHERQRENAEEHYERAIENADNSQASDTAREQSAVHTEEKRWWEFWK